MTIRYGLALSSASSDIVDIPTLLGIVGNISSHPLPSVEQVILGDGNLRGLGLPGTVWEMGYLERSQRKALRVFCPGASADVWITTPTNDSDDAIATYACVMKWPFPENRMAGDATRRIDFNLEFSQFIPYTPST
jgi:hypothetical protein